MPACYPLTRPDTIQAQNGSCPPHSSPYHPPFWPDLSPQAVAPHVSTKRRPWRIRPIQAEDDARIQEVVLGVLAEFGCSGAGFAGADAELTRMHRAYPGGDAVYKIVEVETSAGGGGSPWSLEGGGGFAPLEGSDPQLRCAELRKMYFAPALRGLGAGRALLEGLLQDMRLRRYRMVYLETTQQMAAAQQLYRSVGFREIDEPMGATGHGGCDRFFLLRF